MRTIAILTFGILTFVGLAIILTGGFGAYGIWFALAGTMLSGFLCVALASEERAQRY